MVPHGLVNGMHASVCAFRTSRVRDTRSLRPQRCTRQVQHVDPQTRFLRRARPGLVLAEWRPKPGNAAPGKSPPASPSTHPSHKQTQPNAPRRAAPHYHPSIHRACSRNSYARLRATTPGAAGGGTSNAAAAAKTPDSASGGVFGAVWRRAVKPLLDFGFGRKSLWEGGVGMFLIAGCAFFAMLIGWVKGVSLRNRTQAYQAVLEFPVACGITVGTPVRVRGVRVGNVLSVRPTLESVDVLVEVEDANIVIPRNATIEANQSGLVAETMIDVTPKLPIPAFVESPLSPGCQQEGAIVCARDRVKADVGYSMDELISICTKLAKVVDAHGMNNMLAVADRMGEMLVEARPLVDQAVKLAEEILPVIRQVSDKKVMDTLNRLTETALSTAADVKKLETAIMTDENTELLRQSVQTLTKTLQHIESISGDVGSVTGDPMTRHNLRNLIQALSRLVDA